MDSNKDSNRSEEVISDIRKGAWTEEEDSIIVNYIRNHGEHGHWNFVANCAGLKRPGKSCRLRWLNYLRPGIRRGKFTLQEQLQILDLHCLWGNRWSKITESLHGRTDNDVKNFWRTKVQKQAKQSKCDVNSIEFRDTIRCILIPRLVHQIRSSASSSTSNTASDLLNDNKSALITSADSHNINNDVISAEVGDSSILISDGDDNIIWSDENVEFLRQQLSDDDNNNNKCQ